MKRNTLKMMTVATALLVVLMAYAVPAVAQHEDGVWRTTLIVKTSDGSTMEYVIDKDTKVTIEKPDLVIETNGLVLTYTLESMKQISYGRKFISSGISTPAVADGTPVMIENETLLLSGLPENTLVGIYNTEGKTIMSQRYSGNAQVSLHGLPNGIYFVRYNSETYKILKK